MLKVGLTGSIAVGKSFVSGVLTRAGCPVLDADQTARQVVAKGTIGLNQIRREFGDGVIGPDGELLRAKLAAIVFADEEKRKLLNSIVHPLVIQAQDVWIKEQNSTVAVIDAALMIESGAYKRFDKLIVVWCAPELQLQRLIDRDELSRGEAENRIAAQLSQDEKKTFADYLIDTSAGFDDAEKQTLGVYNQLISDASQIEQRVE